MQLSNGAFLRASDAIYLTMPDHKLTNSFLDLAPELLESKETCLEINKRYVGVHIQFTIRPVYKAIWQTYTGGGKGMDQQSTANNVCQVMEKFGCVCFATPRSYRQALDKAMSQVQRSFF